MEATMRQYYGYAETTESPARVVVRDSIGHIKPLSHHVRHNPGGPSWGYGGPGMLELSRCLLLDAFGKVWCADYPKDCTCANTREWVEASYRTFTTDFVSGFRRDEDWKLGQFTVLDWVFDYRAALSEMQLDTPEPVGT